VVRVLIKKVSGGTRVLVKRLGTPGIEDDFVFQQDNDPKHTARKPTAFFRTSRIKLLDWPAQLPDPNPIENL